MRHGHLLAVDRIARPSANRLRSKMRDDLMAVEVEIDPMVGASAFRAPEQLAVKGPRSREVVDRKGEVERRHGHRWNQWRHPRPAATESSVLQPAC